MIAFELVDALTVTLYIALYLGKLGYHVDILIFLLFKAVFYTVDTLLYISYVGMQHSDILSVRNIILFLIPKSDHRSADETSEARNTTADSKG